MILDQIVSKKYEELMNIKAPKRSLYDALSCDGISIIAEIKRASPSAGAIAKDVDAANRARQYEAGGARAISVVTERHFFKGDLKMLQLAKESSNLPILRKDFMFDELQIYESLFAGADAVLFIVSILKGNKLCDLVKLAQDLGMETLVEVHDEDELTEALKSDAKAIGFNNRDLKTMTVDMGRCESLIKAFCLLEPGSERKLVAESGVRTKEDVKRLQELGFDGILIGETLMRSSNPTSLLKELLGDTR